MRYTHVCGLTSPGAWGEVSIGMTLLATCEQPEHGGESITVVSDPPTREQLEQRAAFQHLRRMTRSDFGGWV